MRQNLGLHALSIDNVTIAFRTDGHAIVANSDKIYPVAKNDVSIAFNRFSTDGTFTYLFYFFLGAPLYTARAPVVHSPLVVGLPIVVVCTSHVRAERH